MPQTSYPIVLSDLSGARCVVVGGGRVAERKAAGLLAAGARPLVISPQLSAGLLALRDGGQIDHLGRPYAAGDLGGAALVFAATDDRAVNAQVAADGRAAGALVNVADDPGLGSFHTVAAVRRGDLLITASTGGQSPAMAAMLRADLAARYGPEHGRALALAHSTRALPAAARADLLAWLCSEQALAWLRAGRDDLVAERLRGAAEAAP